MTSYEVKAFWESLYFANVYLKYIMFKPILPQKLNSKEFWSPFMLSCI